MIYHSAPLCRVGFVYVYYSRYCCIVYYIVVPAGCCCCWIRTARKCMVCSNNFNVGTPATAAVPNIYYIRYTSWAKMDTDKADAVLPQTVWLTCTESSISNALGLSITGLLQLSAWVLFFTRLHNSSPRSHSMDCKMRSTCNIHVHLHRPSTVVGLRGFGEQWLMRFLFRMLHVLINCVI